jgi:hypothetical protein
MTKKLENMEVDDLLGMFKSPEKIEAQGKCTFMRKIENLPSNVQEAISIAVSNKDVTSREILAFINTKTDVKVNLTMVQDHRHKEGCIVCLYGTARA